jgi:RNA polymerase sigma factor (sigma-70 family)
MSGPATPGCSTLLLLRLVDCPTDAAAWDQFVLRYSGMIYAWCRRYHLQDADAQDVTQSIFAALLHRVDQFDRSRGRFRSWLYRIVRNSVIDWCDSRTRREEKGTESTWELLSSLPARRDLETRLGEEFDLELLEIAEASVRLKVLPKSWDAYVLVCKEGLPPREAAKRIGIPAGAGRVSKNAQRARDMVAREVALLEGRSGPDQDEVMEGQHVRLPVGGEMAGVPPGPAQPG